MSRSANVQQFVHPDVTTHYRGKARNSISTEFLQARLLSFRRHIDHLLLGRYLRLKPLPPMSTIISDSAGLDAHLLAIKKAQGAVTSLVALDLDEAARRPAVDKLLSLMVRASPTN